VKQLLLIGAGHAHLVLLRSLAAQPLPGVLVALLTPNPRQIYSGMLPGLVAGHYRLEQISVDVASLAKRAGVALLEGSAAALDPDRRVVRLEQGDELDYDVLSLNAGSLCDTSLAGAKHHALSVKPFESFVERLRFASRIAIVGAGAAGAELAMALRYRKALVTLYADKPVLSSRVERQLRRRGVDYRPGMAVTAIHNGPVVVSGAARQDFDLVIMATGAAPLPWLAHSGLAADERGFALVGDTLQSVSHPEVFAAGDCASIRYRPRPKSGVYSVRHGEILAVNLRRVLDGQPLERYDPQSRALQIITCGARYAIAERGDWSWQGRLVWWWKRRIDRRWIRDLRV
jgi:pyridine nucleotide-disulfide oxidoreductase family protein